jgi:AAA+ superfamily predicted ATPase
LTFIEELGNYTRAAYPLIWIVTQEDERCLSDIMSLRKSQNPMYLWRITKGWQQVNNHIPGPHESSDGSQGPDRDIFKVVSLPEQGFYVMMHMHHFLNNPVVLQAIKDILPLCAASARHLIFISPQVTLPPELEKEVVLMDYSLPMQQDLECMFTDMVQGLEPLKDHPPDAAPFARAALGMTTQEAANAFALTTIMHTENLGNPESVEVVLKQKMQTFKKSGMLEFYPPDLDLSGVGGLDELKNWLHRCEVAFRPEIQSRHVSMPKGILLMGIPGTGKSLTAKAIAKQWGWPMLKLDMGRIFNSYIGSSEANIRQALKMAGAVAPVVLMIDELDKGMAGIGSSGSTDSGVTARVTGTVLTWMQDKVEPVFVVATVNRVKGLPPELLRKGRFDEIWWVDLPNETERREIFNIHLAKREIDLSICEKWITDTKGFSGSEIEAVVADALLTALADDREIDTTDINHSIKKLIPLSTTMREDIEEMQRWARDRAQMANSPSIENIAGNRALNLRGQN